MTPARAEVAALLTARRGERSKREIAKAAGIDRSYYIRIEKGDVGVGATVAVRLAPILGGDPLDYVSDPRERAKLTPAKPAKRSRGDLEVRLGLVEAELNRLGADLKRLTTLLERQAPAGTRQSATPRK